MTFAATCPYVTAVGGTHLGAGLIEVGVNFAEQFWSASGGFSPLFDRPSYQDTVVPPYVTGLDDFYAGRYKQAERGFPDGSALGVDSPWYAMVMIFPAAGLVQ